MSDPRRLTGRVAFVTGASRGLGEAIARRLADEGARVVLAARDLEACERHAAAIREKGREAVAVSCDVDDRASVARAVAAGAEQWGRLDILVNNAGLGGATPLDDADDARWDAILATNLTAVFRVTREAAPRLSPGGRVINLSSVLGRFGVAGYAPRQITVNAICPGWVETAMAREGFRRFGSEEKGREAAAKMAPLNRVLDPAEIAGLAAYLASDDARSVTGQAIVADGGQVMP